MNLNKYPSPEQRRSFVKYYLSHLSGLNEETRNNEEFIDGFQVSTNLFLDYAVNSD